MAYEARLAKEYKERIVPALMAQFGYTSVMQVPKIEKICLSRGLGDAIADKKVLEYAANEFGLISGQKPVITKSKKDISLITVAMPRIRDFRGISQKSFDGRGNYNFGVKEQIIFPEIDVDKIDKIAGMDITIVTSARTDEEAFALLKEFGMPFQGVKKA